MRCAPRAQRHLASVIAMAHECNSLPPFSCSAPATVMIGEPSRTLGARLGGRQTDPVTPAATTHSSPIFLALSPHGLLPRDVRGNCAGALVKKTALLSDT